jgi:hypothetical protein
MAPYTKGLKPFQSYKQHEASADGIIQVLKWRLNSIQGETGQVTISAQEFSQLYIEWLKRKDISIDHMNLCNLQC